MKRTEKFSSKIKHLLIELQDYKFFHSPFGKTKPDNRFIGRNKVLNRLKNILENSDTRSGAYLVTGFRGMGKTSLVRKAIREIIDANDEKKKHGDNKKEIIRIEISLAQDDIQDIDILRLLAKNMMKDIDKVRRKRDIDDEIKKKYNKLFDRLESLNDSIIAQVTNQKINTHSKQSFLGKGLLSKKDEIDNLKAKVYPIYGIKEIEYELIDIFDSVHKLFDEDEKPQFIFVFDELDKIAPNFNLVISEKEAGDPFAIKDSSQSIFTTENVRKRQETVIKILANLKHFLNVAEAKFIFIAGREMFDASMADTSDRDSFLGSIFHDIIYVNSFLKDKIDSASSGLTTMTEAYVCQFLIPKSFINEDRKCSLQTYNTYLESLPNQLNDEERQKVIFTLQNFIIYLTYRSNGTPKKLTKLFENYIYRVEKDDEINSHDYLIVEKIENENSKTEIYLRFTYNHQYTFGLITYLFRPYLISHSRHAKNYSDKLLVSISFLMDHLFKFHSSGFGWRNFELTPEIITVNKSPELRRFIEDIIGFLSNSHVREIERGLYQFKFFSKISNEIRYISKISELEAAAFNFTLDESLPIKRHYKKRLQELKKNFSNYSGRGSKSDYVHSIGFVSMLLGDLHYYDEEFDEAFVYYSNSIHYLRPKNNKWKLIPPRQFMLFVRNKLKMILTLEKMKVYDTTLISYTELIEDVLAYLPKNPNFSLDILKLGMQPLLGKLASIEKESLTGIIWQDIRDVLKKFNAINDSKNVITDTNKAVFYGNIASILYYKNGNLKSEVKSKLSSIKEEVFASKITENLLPVNNSKHFRAPISAYVFTLKALFQMLAVANDIIIPQKKTKTYRDDYLKGEEELLIKYTNYLIDASQELNFSSSRKSQLTNIGKNLSKLGDIILCFAAPNKDRIISKSFLSDLLKYNYEDERFKDSFINLVDAVYSKENNLFQRVFLFYILSGSFFLKGGKTVSYAFQLRKLLYVIKEYLSTYRRTEGNGDEIRVENGIDICEVLKDKLVSQILRALSWANDISDRPQILKYRDIFSKLYGGTHAIYNNIASNPETREVIITYGEILMKMGKNKFSLKNNIISPYSGISSRFIRMQELTFKAQLNYHFFKLFNFKELFDKISKKCEGLDRGKTIEKSGKIMMCFFEKRDCGDIELMFEETHSAYDSEKKKAWGDEAQEIDIKETLEFLITDSVFCLHEIIKTLRIYDISYMCSYSYLAYTHKKLGDWAKYYTYYSAMYAQSEKESGYSIDNLRTVPIYKTLERLIGKNSIYNLEAKYQYQVAKQYFYSSIQAHNEGVAYQKIINNFYYLEDDYNDNFYQFCAALERFKVNIGEVEKQIDNLKKELKTSALYKYESYLNLQNPSSER